MENNMDVQDFINSVATGNAAEAKDTLNNLLSARAFEALETKKVEIAQTLFGGYQVEEEVEQIDELKKSTLGSYVKKASSNLSARSYDHGEDEHRQYGYGDDDEEDKRVDRDEKKIATRQQGINRAATKLSK
jgi:hypothetical protein